MLSDISINSFSYWPLKIPFGVINMLRLKPQIIGSWLRPLCPKTKSSVKMQSNKSGLVRISGTPQPRVRGCGTQRRGH